MDKPKLAGISSRTRLEIFAAVFIGFNLIFLLFRFYHKYLLGEGWPIANPMYDPVYRFLDFYEINMAIHGLNPYISGLTNYPPLAILLALPFALVSDYSRFDSFGAVLKNDDPAIKMSFLIFVAIFYVGILAASVIMITLKNRKKTFHDYSSALLLFSLLAVSTPVLFAIDRGNYLLFTTIFLVMWAILEEEKPDSIWGAVFLGLAAATKIYPIYMLMIYVMGRKFKKLIAAIITGLVTTIVPIFFFQGSFIDNCRWFYHGVMGFGGGSSYVLSHNVGLTAMVGYIYRMNGMDPNSGVIKIVWFITGAALTILVAGIFIFEKTMWKKVLLTVSLMVLLTPNSGLYNSCYLIAPIMIMVLGDNEYKVRDIPYLILSAVLMVPLAYYYLPDTDYNKFYNDLNIAVLADALLYLGIIVYYIVTTVPEVINVLKAKRNSAIKQSV